jgi:hypothetical protein
MYVSICREYIYTRDTLSAQTEQKDTLYAADALGMHNFGEARLHGYNDAQCRTVQQQIKLVVTRPDT